MPKVSQNFVEKLSGNKYSFVAFDLKKEDIFLSYTSGLEHGPGIERTGRGSPSMSCLHTARKPGETTTDPDGQRLRSWLIHDELRLKDMLRVWKRLWRWVGAHDTPHAAFIEQWIGLLFEAQKAGKSEEALKGTSAWTKLVAAENNDELSSVVLEIDVLLGLAPPSHVKDALELWKKLAVQRQQLKPSRPIIQQIITDLLSLACKYGLPKTTHQILTAYLAESLTTKAHDKELVKKFGGRKTIIGQQGCGDLTMNLWNIAFYRSPSKAVAPAKLLFLHKEPIEQRTYSCLVKWAQPPEDRRVEIRDMRFSPYADKVDAMALIYDTTKQDWVNAGDRIEFAVSNQQVIRNGKSIDVTSITHEFADFRHLIKMPNLNPAAKLKLIFDDGTEIEDAGPPRYYFGTKTHDDIWFGEAQFISDPNLQRAAMQGPVFLSRLYQGLGALKEQVRGAFKSTNYVEVKSARQELKEGEYRFCAEDDTLVEVYLKRNVYGWTMIGLTEDATSLLCWASEGNPGKHIGYTLEEAAEEFCKLGAHNALLIDEGTDVFQRVQLKDTDEKLTDLVPLQRTRLERHSFSPKTIRQGSICAQRPWVKANPFAGLHIQFS